MAGLKFIFKIDLGEDLIAVVIFSTLVVVLSLPGEYNYFSPGHNMEQGTVGKKRCEMDVLTCYEPSS